MKTAREEQLEQFNKELRELMMRHYKETELTLLDMVGALELHKSAFIQAQVSTSALQSAIGKLVDHLKEHKDDDEQGWSE